MIWLAEGLRDLGHSVTVAALEGSRLPKGVTFLPVEYGARSAEALLRRVPKGTEIVHFQAPPEAGYFREGAPPSLTTIHGNARPGEKFPEHTVFLSRDHAERHERKRFVYNGINPSEFGLAPELGTQKRTNAPLFLSKTTLRTKNLAGAFQISRRAGAALTIAGGNRPLGVRFQALLAGYQWAGPVNGERKARLLAEASALLFPVVWDEPFGLVMVEAMLSGTAVVGSRKGSVPEVVGATGGKILDLPKGEADEESYQAWATALKEAQAMDPVELRRQAIERFSHLRMAESYLGVYNEVIRGEFR